MKYLICCLIFALSTSVVPAVAQGTALPQNSTAIPSGATSDTMDVQHVIDAYHEAVLTHDGARIARLFIPQGSMWLNVLSEDAYARAKAKSPNATKTRVGSYTDFATMVSSTKANLNPTHTNLTLNSDGTIASVYFDFVFLIDGKAQNRGSETWILVKGGLLLSPSHRIHPRCNPSRTQRDHDAPFSS